MSGRIDGYDFSDESHSIAMGAINASLALGERQTDSQRRNDYLDAVVRLFKRFEELERLAGLPRRVFDEEG